MARTVFTRPPPSRRATSTWCAAWLNTAPPPRVGSSSSGRRGRYRESGKEGAPGPRAPGLSLRMSGDYHLFRRLSIAMVGREQNELLCRVEGAAAMGQLMRRHWLPVCLSEEVAEKDGPPVRARLLGEDLVVFRNSSNVLGVLDEHCPHRGASLVYGRNEDRGLRCLYHGW